MTTSKPIPSRKVSPPGPMAQYINKMLHTEPYSFIFHGLFWGTILTFACPMIGWALLVLTLSKGVRILLNWDMSNGMIDPKEEVSKGENRKEFAVYITGCDTGFGKDLTFALASKGFVVFPACLTENGIKQYQGFDSIIPLSVDVTKDEDSINAASAVSKWLQESSTKSSRCLHAIVNNAGIGGPGLIDWSSVSNYEKVMDVNYFGVVRTTKAFLSILKDQASTNSHTGARIINVASVAGIFAGSLGSSMYSGSKHAVEAFTACLRLELKPFNIAVTTVNPSSHSTAMVSDTEVFLRKSWNALSPEMRQEYGEDYFLSLLKSVEKLKQVSWSPKYVEEALVSCVALKSPKSQVLVGMDAKYFLAIIRILPMWMQAKVLKGMASKALPECMKKLS